MAVPQSVTPVVHDQPSAGRPGFDCSLTVGPQRVMAWVTVAGELDSAAVPQLERALHSALREARVVLLDLRALNFIDSSGVHAVTAVAAHARQAAQQLVVLRGPPRVSLVFALLKVDAGMVAS